MRAKKELAPHYTSWAHTGFVRCSCEHSLALEEVIKNASTLLRPGHTAEDLTQVMEVLAEVARRLP